MTKHRYGIQLPIVDSKGLRMAAQEGHARVSSVVKGGQMRWDGPTKEVAHCTAPVRWCDGKLQQKWVISTVTNGAGCIGIELARREEWRGVPTHGGEDRT